MSGTCSFIDESLENFFFSSKAWTFFAKFMLRVAPPHVDQQVLCNINKFLTPENPQSKAKDATAGQKAMAFRNGAVFLALMGITTFYLAILPYAVTIEESVGFSFAVVEAVFFVITALLVHYLIHKKSEWTQVRSESEHKRYERLKYLIDQKNATDELKDEFRNHLTEQIGYNKERFEMYESIEKGSSRLTWVLFVFTFSAVIGHLFIHHEWLLLVTAGFPIIAASLHALNSITNVQRLSDDHKHILEKLEKIHNEKEGDLISNAARLHSVLTNNDLIWAQKTLDSQVTPP